MYNVCTIDTAVPSNYNTHFFVETKHISGTNEYQCNIKLVTPIQRNEVTSLELVIVVSGPVAYMLYLLH